MPTLKEIREAKGLSLVEVGRATGLHDTTVSKVERGLIRLTPRVYYLLTKFYGTTDIDMEVHTKEDGTNVAMEPYVHTVKIDHEFTEEDFRILRETRKKLGLRLVDVGRALDLHHSTISNYERGKDACVETYNRIVAFYNLDHKIIQKEHFDAEAKKQKQVLKRLKRPTPKAYAEEEIVDKLVSLRTQTGYTLQEVSRLLGIGASSLYEYEKKLRKMPIEKASMLFALYTGDLLVPNSVKAVEDEQHKKSISQLRKTIYQLQCEVSGLKRRLRKALQMEEHIIAVVIKLKDNYIKAVTKISDIEKEFELNELWEFSMNPKIEMEDEDEDNK